MLKLISILFFLVFSGSVLAEDAIVKIGVTSSIAIQKKEIKKSELKILFERKNSDLVLMNDLITGQSDFAIVSADYALQAVWYGDIFDIVGKMENECFGFIVNITDKLRDIFLTANTGGDFFIQNALKDDRLNFSYLNSYQLIDKINKEKATAFIEPFLISFIKNKSSTVKISKGSCFIVTMKKNVRYLRDKNFIAAFGGNRLTYHKLNSDDVNFLEKLNNSIKKKASLDESFQRFKNER